MRLYLANIHLATFRYMEDITYETVTRIVIAEDDVDAEKKIKAEFEIDETYSTSVQVNGIELHEAIGGSLATIA